MIESLLLTTARVSSFFGTQALTEASGFFFERDGRLYLFANRHVLVDRPSGHLPDRIEIEVHTDTDNPTHAAVLSVLLYRDGMAIWHQGRDGAGAIDVAAIELDRKTLPATVALRCFAPAHLQHSLQTVKVGTPLLVVVVGFPLGFHDTLHHLPVVRQATIASSFGLRFQGKGYFLTDARTHRGSSGAPVVMQDDAGDPQLPWELLGVHFARLEVGRRSLPAEEALGPNCACTRTYFLPSLPRTLSTRTCLGPLYEDAVYSGPGIYPDRRQRRPESGSRLRFIAPRQSGAQTLTQTCSDRVCHAQGIAAHESRFWSRFMAADQAVRASTEHAMKHKAKVRRSRDLPRPAIIETAAESPTAPATPTRTSIESLDEHKTGSIESALETDPENSVAGFIEPGGPAAGIAG